VGDNIVIFNKLLPTIIGGTSASCPVFAAVLTRINDERLKAGKSTVGFVNPILVSLAVLRFTVNCTPLLDRHTNAVKMRE